MWKVWMSLVLALWLVLSGLAGVVTGGNFIVSGVLIAIFGFWAGGPRGALIGVLGLWTLLSGFVPSLVTSGNLIITGVLVAVLAIWKRVAMGRRREPYVSPR